MLIMVIVLSLALYAEVINQVQIQLSYIHLKNLMGQNIF